MIQAVSRVLADTEDFFHWDKWSRVEETHMMANMVPMGKTQADSQAPVLKGVVGGVES